ncbi:hypothetical protein [Ideonella sp. YS5]|uniref:hypothetical protein n=1 Tax=Ideonella sp. YS5 TaxID=3453714 RepID=UPI003F71BE1B
MIAMKKLNYLGHDITSHACSCDGQWRGGFQIDDAPMFIIDGWPASFDELGAHADALGQAMSAIDRTKGCQGPPRQLGTKGAPRQILETLSL